MKISTMKFIDGSLGKAVCIFLNFFENIKGFFRKDKKIISPKNILISKYFGIGSILHSLPMCNLIKKHYQEAKIIYLTFSGNKEFCEFVKIADEILVIRNDNFFNFIIDFFQILFLLRKRKIDIAIDLEFFSKFSTMIIYLIGAERRMGFFLRAIHRGKLLTDHIYFNQYKNIRRIFLAFAEAVGCDPNQAEKPEIKISEETINSLKNELVDLGLKKNEKIITVNINAGELSLARRWSKENFIELIKRIKNKHPLINIIFIGSKSEANYANEAYKQVSYLKRIFNLAGQLDFPQLFALLKISNLLITNDSGPLHIADFLGTKTVSFFGPETPILYGPQDGNHIIFYKNLYCSPCMNVYNVKTASCNDKNNKCLRSITVDEVWSKIKDLQL